jgi:hypothetical protein
LCPSWLVDLAPTGVVEFVPKNDPMVQRLLRLRDDIFSDYTAEHFLQSLQKRARVVAPEMITASDRMLVWFDRR